MSNPLKHQSHIITEGRDRAGARSMFKAIGFTDDDLGKPIIGIANTWIETMPCNFNLRDLAVKVKEGVRAAGGTPMGVQHHRYQRRDHDGDRGHEGLARQP